MGKLHPTNIQWATHAVNPIVAIDRATGKRGWACTKIAAGCQHCYAEQINRARFGTGHAYDVKPEALVEWRLDEPALESVLRRRKPATIFWADMTDLFHERVPDEWLDRCFAVMALTPQHRHVVLTKRAKRMREYVGNAGVPLRIGRAKTAMGRTVHELAFAFTADLTTGTVRYNWWPLPNVALGVSVADQDDADDLMPELLNTPAALRFVSYEPAIGAINLDRIDAATGMHILTGLHWEYQEEGVGPSIDLVIVGGESGKGARPFDLAWARSTVSQCAAAGVAVMVKQLGAKPFICPVAEPYAVELEHSHGGDPSEWPEDLRPYAALPERWPWEAAP